LNRSQCLHVYTYLKSAARSQIESWSVFDALLLQYRLRYRWLAL